MALVWRACYVLTRILSSVHAIFNAAVDDTLIFISYEGAWSQASDPVSAAERV